MGTSNANNADGITGTTEVDYDANPTLLYTFIEKKQITEAIERCAKFPQESATWIVKKEESGIRWKLLPLHAALIIRAGDSLVKALLKAFPNGAEEKDDQGMLAMHLAFRHSASESIINLLLDIYPDGMYVKDSKGRIPLQLVSKGSDKKKGGKFRLFASTLVLNNNNSSDIEQQLDEANKKIMRLTEKLETSKNLKESSSPSEEGINDQIEELEAKLNSVTENYNRAIIMFEKRTQLRENEKAFLIQQVESATEASESTMEMYKHVQKKHEKETSTMKKKYRELRNENTQCKKQIEEMKSQIRELEGREKKMTEEKETLSSSVKELTSLNLQFKKQIPELESSIENLESQLESSIENLESQKDHMQNDNTSLQERLAAATKQNEEDAKTIEQLEEQNKILQNEVSCEKEERATIQTKLEGEVGELQHNVENLKSVKAELASLQLKYNEEITKYEVKVGSLQTEVDGLISLKGELTGDKYLLKTSLENTKRCLEVEEKKGSSYLKIIEGLKAQIAGSSSQLNTHNNVYETEKEEMNEMLAVLKEQVEHLNSENEAKDNRIETLNTELIENKKDSKAQIAELEDMVYKLEDHYAASQDEIDLLKRQHRNAVIEKEALYKVKQDLVKLTLNDKKISPSPRNGMLSDADGGNSVLFSQYKNQLTFS